MPFQDFGINDLSDLVKIFDKIIGRVRDPIMKAINAFKKLINTVKKKGIQGLFNDFIKAMKDLPLAVKKLIENLTNFFKEISDYEGLPWIAAIKRVVNRIRFFIEDVQADIMGFYNVNTRYR